MARAYYNEFEPYAAQWLRNLIDAGLIPQGDVDERSIVDVAPADLAGYTQCHFFAGLGGWGLAARLAGWPDDRELWTGSPPCQPFSVAGQGKAQADDRHLWPHLFRLARARRPAVFMGEQVAAAVGKNWLDGVLADLEGIDYAGGAVVVPACAVDAPHRRDRLWFVAYTERGGSRREVPPPSHVGAEADRSADRPGGCRGARDPAYGCAVADADAGAGAQREQRSGQFGGAGGDPGACAVADACDGRRREPREREVEQQGRAEALRPGMGHWSQHAWILGHDGKARRVEPGIRLLAHGVPARVGRLRAYGNAIVPQVAAEVIGAFLDCMPRAA